MSQYEFGVLSTLDFKKWEFRLMDRTERRTLVHKNLEQTLKQLGTDGWSIANVSYKEHGGGPDHIYMQRVITVEFDPDTALLDFGKGDFNYSPPTPMFQNRPAYIASWKDDGGPVHTRLIFWDEISTFHYQSALGGQNATVSIYFRASERWELLSGAQAEHFIEAARIVFGGIPASEG